MSAVTMGDPVPDYVIVNLSRIYLPILPNSTWLLKQLLITNLLDVLHLVVVPYNNVIDSTKNGPVELHRYWIIRSDSDILATQL